MHHDSLTTAQQQRFAERFLATWMEKGFGVLTKAETELLVFDILRELLDPERTASNYEWTEYLRVGTARIRRLRLDAHLRYRHGAPVLSAFLRRIQRVNIAINLDSGGVFDGSEVRLLVEDPAVQHELENAIKQVGGIVHHERNREVVRVGAMHFLAVVSKVEDFDEDGIVRELAQRRVDDDGARKRLTEMTRAVAYKRMSEIEKLAHAIEVVGETLLGEKPAKLAKYLADIVRAQRATG